MLHKQVYQPYVYTYPLPLVSPSLASHPIPLGHHRALSWAPCAIQLSILCISSVQMLSCVRLFETPRTATCQASLSIINSWSLLKLMSIKLVMPSNHLILCWPLLLWSSIFPSMWVFSKESVLRIRWPKYWRFSFSISPSFKMDWLDLLAVQDSLESFPTTQFKSINSLVLSFLYSPTLTSIHDYWKNHSFG